jgi:hypothetical protein
MNTQTELSATGSNADPDDVTYQRTMRGNAVTRDPNADMPRMMKTLLMAVDGKTSVAMFQKLLPNFGDVGALLLALQANGLVEPRKAGEPVKPRTPLRVVNEPTPAPASAAPRPLVRESAFPAQRSTFGDTQAQSSFNPSGSRFEAESAWHSTAGRTSTLQQGDGAAFNPYTALVPNTLSGKRHAIVESSRVREARSRMTTFLFQYRPDVAMEASLSLERLETTEQMLVNLEEYKRLIASAGRVAVDHLAEVRRILSS